MSKTGVVTKPFPRPNDQNSDRGIETVIHFFSPVLHTRPNDQNSDRGIETFPNGPTQASGHIVRTTRIPTEELKLKPTTLH